MQVLPFEQARDQLSHSQQGCYLFKYLNELDTVTVVVEEDYIDKDFLIDYTKFYARSFKSPERFTIRLHSFSSVFTLEEFKKAIVNNNEGFINNLQQTYLGFIVIKPINKALSIGRTVLKTYPEKTEEEHRCFLTQQHQVSLYGIPLSVSSLPFQSQDMAVAACATASLWMTSYPLHVLFGTPLHSPVEITEKSVTYPGEQRNFPSEGLTLMQMINFISSLGLDTEVIGNTHQTKSIIPDVIKAYIKAKIPIIAGVALKKGDSIVDYHAVVISGYRYDYLGNIKEIYIHDDQIGPYSRVKPEESWDKWKNAWTENHSFEEVSVEKLLIPVYPKIRLTFGRIYKIYLEEKKRIESKGLSAEIYLTQINDYKQHLLKQNIKDKEKILITPLSRFLWIIRAHIDGRSVIETVYDGTAVFPEKLSTVQFM